MASVVLTSLCDEALTFRADPVLLGFCLDNPDEPQGDDFDSRRREEKEGLRWVDIEEHVAEFTDEERRLMNTAADDEDDEDAEGDDAADVSLVDLYGDFLRLSESQKISAMSIMCKVLLQELSLTEDEWKPSRELIIAFMRRVSSGVDSTHLRIWLEDEYYKVIRKYEDHMARAITDSEVMHDDDERLDGRVFSQHGGWESRRPGLYESTGGASLWVDREGRWHGEDSHGKFWVLENEEHQTRKKAREGFHHFERRSRTHNDRRETIRTNAPHYFGFAGKGDGFDEYVDSYEAFGEPEVVPEAVANHWVPDPWWTDRYDLNEALRDMEWWKENRHSLFRSRVRRVRRPGSFWEDWDDLYYDDYRCAYVEQDHREGYLFEDYHGPDNPMTGEDDPLDHLDHFDYLCVSHGTRVLIRFGTPRQQLRMAG